MKTKPLLLILLLFPLVLSAQDLTMSFVSGDATPLDSITAMNVRTGEMVTFPGNENLILKDVTGIDLIDNNLDVLIYPNPNTGQSTIAVSIPESQDIVISVRNQLGQLVTQSRKSVQTGTQAFTLSLETAGIYSVIIQHSKGLESRQVITTKNGTSGNSLSYIGHSSLVTSHHSTKSGVEGNSLPFVMGDMIRYTYFGSIHCTICQDEPREVKDYNYEVNFYPCTDPDGLTYPVVEIGDQVWMAKNLAYLPSVSPTSDESNTSPRYYVFGNTGTSIADAKNLETYDYGVLYNYDAAIISCPEGWHLASDSDWMILEGFLGMNASDQQSSEWRNSGEVGNKLKSKSRWFNEGNGIDRVGFNVIPTGWEGNGIYNDSARVCPLWTSTPGIDQLGYIRWFEFDQEGSARYQSGKKYAGAVRCLKDSTSGNQPPTAVFTITPEAGPNSTTFTFDASGCTDDNTPQEDLEVRWDFEFEYEDEWDTQFSTEKVATYLYYYQETYTVKMQVTDSEGLTSIASRTVVVNNFGTMVDDRDGQEYKTVVIGSQTWMAENLNFETEEGSYCYGDDTINCASYGRLYPFAVATSNHGNGVDICPTGWHLPSDDEWKVMESYLGMNESDLHSPNIRMSGSIGKKIKNTEGWWEPGSNSSGFTALTGGMYGNIYGDTSTQNLMYYMGPDDPLGPGGFFLTSTLAEEGIHWDRNLIASGDGIVRTQRTVLSRESVRCVKDIEGSSDPPTASISTRYTSGTNLETYLFDATGCTDDIDPMETLMVRWDFDYDGEDTWDTGYSMDKMISYKFESWKKIYTVRVQAKDMHGGTDIATIEINISNEGEITDLRDGLAYRTIIIGEQIWMGENLKYETDEGSVCYKNNPDTCAVYGRLYTFEAAEKACPDGYHLPTDDEWLDLEIYLGMEDPDLTRLAGWRESGEVGKKLKATTNWTANELATNEVGFSALGGGAFGNAGQGFAEFTLLNEWGFFWSSTPHLDPDNHFIRIFTAASVASGRWNDEHQYNEMNSVRCIKDE